MKANIFIALSTFAEHGDAPIKLLSESGCSFALNPLKKRLNQDELIEMGKDYEGIIAGVEPYNQHVLEHMPRLRCISRCGVGLDNIALDKAKEKKIEVRNTPEVVVQPVAELTVAFIFDLLRKLTYHTILMKNKVWAKKAGSLLKGKNIGILGVGCIGKKVAEMLLKLEANVFGSDVYPDHQWAQKEGVKMVPVDELLKISDILSIHISASADHPFTLGRKEISQMKQGAMIVNVSRGQFIDEEALYEALKSERLAGAAMDVFPQEPYSGKLCELDNVVFTPHMATLTNESRLQMELEATKNLLDFFKTNKTGRLK